MSLYQFLIFIHVLGAVALFVAIGIEAVSLARLRQAETVADARVWLRSLKLPGRLGPIAMLTALASGAWMMKVSWGYQPWIAVALVALVGMAVTGGAISLRGMRRLRTALRAETGSGLSERARTIRSSPALVTSLRIRIALGVGILGLMTMKPSDHATAVLVFGTAALAALVASIGFARRSGAPTHPTATAAHGVVIAGEHDLRQA
jgi:hypothetical protein